MIKGDGAALTHVLATVCQTSPASIGDLITTDGAFIACNLNDLDNIGIFGIAAHSDFDAFCQNGSFLINTTAHGGCVAGHDGFGNI